jgi:hypothetical protein
MTSDSAPLGTVASDADTPTFELVRIKLKAGKDVSPNTLVRIPIVRSEPVALILLGCFAFVNSLEYDSGHKPGRH